MNTWQEIAKEFGWDEDKQHYPCRASSSNMAKEIARLRETSPSATLLMEKLKFAHDELKRVTAERDGWHEDWRISAHHESKVLVESEQREIDLVQQLNQLRARCEGLTEALEKIQVHCVCLRNTKGFDYDEKHLILGKPKAGIRWLVPYEIAAEALKKFGPDGDGGKG